MPKMRPSGKPSSCAGGPCGFEKLMSVKGSPGTRAKKFVSSSLSFEFTAPLQAQKETCNSEEHALLEACILQCSGKGFPLLLVNDFQTKLQRRVNIRPGRRSRCPRAGTINRGNEHTVGVQGNPGDADHALLKSRDNLQRKEQERSRRKVLQWNFKPRTSSWNKPFGVRWKYSVNRFNVTVAMAGSTHVWDTQTAFKQYTPSKGSVQTYLSTSSRLTRRSSLAITWGCAPEPSKARHTRTST